MNQDPFSHSRSWGFLVSRLLIMAISTPLPLPGRMMRAGKPQCSGLFSLIGIVYLFMASPTRDQTLVLGSESAES